MADEKLNQNTEQNTDSDSNRPWTPPRLEVLSVTETLAGGCKAVGDGTKAFSS
mgnify:CR=1 FL=1